MEYRKIGNTGMSASVIGFGAEHLDGKPYDVVDEVVGSVLDHGINIMDIFMPGETIRSNIGKALAGRRDKMLIQGHIGSCDLKEQYDITRDPAISRKYFESLMRCLNTDYIDIGMLFFIDTDEELEKLYINGIVDYALEMKQKGIIRAIGASSHNSNVALKLVESGLIELLMFSVNPAFDLMPSQIDLMAAFNDLSGSMTAVEPSRANLYRACEQRGVAITTMKTLCAGKLLSSEHTPFNQPMTVGQCIHYALTRPGVVSSLIGYQSPAHVEEAVNYLNLTDSEKNYTSVLASFQGGFKGNCVYCNHCLPCPVGIDVASVNRYLDIALLNEKEIPPSILQHYRSLKHNASECIECGNCEKRCPFSVPVIERMKRATAVMS